MSKNGLSMSEREEKQPADVLQDAICTWEDTPLRILPSKYKHLRAAFPGSALGGVHGTLRSNERLGMRHRLRHRFIRNADSGTENYSVCMRWDVSLFCSARCCSRSEGIKATWCRSRVTGV
jgi:hypothetical protein